MVTGAGTPPWLPNGETDGPPGAAVLARALDVGLGVKPVLVAEERCLPAVVAAAEGVGLAVLPSDLFAVRGGCATAERMAVGTTAGPAAARELFARHRPNAVIFVEKGAPNAKGVFHTITGTGRSREIMASADELATEATAQGVLTIGIGDGGNEIGFGMICDAVADIQPAGRVCRCGCGIAAATSTNILLVAAISNWGAYGLAAALACLLGRRAVLHDAEAERRMLERTVAAGAADGVLARLVPAVDGTSAAAQQAIVTLLGNLVENALQPLERPF